MKKILLFFSITCTVISCDKAKQMLDSAAEATGTASIDYQMFSKEAESQKWFDAVVEKMGTNAKVCDEVSFYISRPSKEGMIKREGDPDYMTISIDYQDSVDKRRIEEINYFSSSGGWKAPEKKEIQVVGAGAENFKLENELFDFSVVTYDIFKKVLADAMAKYKNDAKYEYQYISNIGIKKSGFDISIHGKLKSNGQEKFETYYTDLKGNPKK